MPARSSATKRRDSSAKKPPESRSRGETRNNPMRDRAEPEPDRLADCGGVLEILRALPPAPISLNANSFEPTLVDRNPRGWNFLFTRG